MHVFVLKRGRLVAYLMIFCGAIIAAAMIFFFGGSILEAATGTKRYPINSVETTQKEVALTFDTVYGDADFSMVLGFLNRYNTKATFFVTKDFAMQYRGEVEAIVSAGHDLMSLSNRYASMADMNFTDIASGIADADETIRNISLKKPTMFRPPTGAVNNRIIEVADSLGYLTVMYNINAESYNDSTPEGLASKITSDIRDGSIIRFRIGVTADTYALSSVVEYLENNGYKILPLSQLLMKNDYEVDQNGVQRKTRIIT